MAIVNGVANGVQLLTPCDLELLDLLALALMKRRSLPLSSERAQASPRPRQSLLSPPPLLYRAATNISSLSTWGVTLAPEHLTVINSIIARMKVFPSPNHHFLR